MSESQRSKLWVGETSSSYSYVVESALEPPQVLTRMRLGEFELLNKAGISLNKLLHSTQEFELDRPVSAGDSLNYTTRISGWLEKRGASPSLKIITFETHAWTKDIAEHRARSVTTVVVKG